MRRAGLVLLLLATACEGSGGEGGGSPWQPGLEQPPEPEQTTSGGGYPPPPSTSTFFGTTCDDGSESDEECSCGDEYDNVGRCFCTDDCHCEGCPLGACGTDFEGDDNYCLESHCCDAIRSCALDDDRACDECLYAGGGDRCDGLIACGSEFECEFTRIARLCRTTGIRYDVRNATDRCIAANCCAEVVGCVARRGESSCEACIRTGSDDPECDSLLECMAANDCGDDGDGDNGGAGGSDVAPAVGGGGGGGAGGG